MGDQDLARIRSCPGEMTLNAPSNPAARVRQTSATISALVSFVNPASRSSITPVCKRRCRKANSPKSVSVVRKTASVTLPSPRHPHRPCRVPALGDVQDIMTLLPQAVDDRSVNAFVGDQLHADQAPME